MNDTRAAAPIIGIDLGTTNSLCAVFEAGAPRLVRNAHGEDLTPSVVALLEDGRVLVGAPACELRITNPADCAWCFKRRMGTDANVELAGRTLSPTELSSLVLRSLKADAEADLGCEITDAVITVPAYFNEHQREATRLAGKLAGLTVRRILNEPTAAALTYGFHERQADKTLLVFDLGGGTFDVTLMEIFEGTLEIVSTAGESHLGGEDFTDRLVQWVLTQHGAQLEVAEFREPLRVARLREGVERAKRELQHAEGATVRYPGSDGTLVDTSPELEITRALFERETEELRARLERPVLRALRDGRRSAAQVDDVVLVGGATRMRSVETLVAETLDRIALSTHDPDRVVALGAAIQAALIADDSAVEDMVLTDVCPFTLGIEITKQFGKQMVDGYYMPIIHRNTTIPVSREEHVATLFPNQRELTLRIYQGEERRTEGNLLLGELKVTGLPLGPAGEQVAVRFTYDLNGLLEVEAYVPSTNVKFKSVLTHQVKGLSPEAIDAALDEMQKLKFYPRDDVDNRRLVLFCERVLGEVNPFEREGLEELLDGFETSMAAGDRELFGKVRGDLLIHLSGLGFDFREQVEDEADEG